LITAKALQTKTFAPVRIIVPGLIPEGVTILAGKPKIGKSWLALDICAAVAADRFVLGETKPVQGDAFTSRSKTINGG
jgi:predicted ATP-dependent serine protease